MLSMKGRGLEKSQKAWDSEAVAAFGKKDEAVAKTRWRVESLFKQQQPNQKRWPSLAPRLRTHSETQELFEEIADTSSGVRNVQDETEIFSHIN